LKLRSRALLALSLSTAVALSATAAPVLARSARDAKVVVIVGPAGSATQSYRLLAEEAARAAESAGARVVRIYSPNATWPAARTALEGASIVVYLGHGNGWPSRYRSQPAPQSQNGLGLNPAAGVDDTAHQYFGEFYLARDVRLARGAVVVMARLCYASGNSEPGLPEGSLSDAKQRVDNYGAGWIKSGARAVIADAFTSPAFYVRELLTSGRSVQSIWRGSPNYRGHVMRFASERSSAHILQLDPDRPMSGFYRSLVIAGNAQNLSGVPAGSGAGGGSGPLSMAGTSGPARSPTLVEIGFRFGRPVFTQPPTAGRPVSLKVPVTVPPGEKLPQGIIGGVRWDPLDVSPRPSKTVPLAPPAADEASQTTGQSGSATGAGDSIAAPIVAETLGDVVLTQLTSVSAGGLMVRVPAPRTPGLYRLTITLADRSGQPVSEGKEPLIPPQLVRIAGPLAATYRVDRDVSVPVGGEVELPVTVLNSGSASWKPRDTVRGRAPAPRLTAHWMGLGQSELPMEPASVAVGALEPGESASVRLRLRTPDSPGRYALVLDVITPQDGSLVAAGAEEGLVRVVVDADFHLNDDQGALKKERPAD
jgi:hypothetical protein